jgi:hypothetical protein
MGENLTPALIRMLKTAGRLLVRHGKGDHDIWESPIKGRRFPVDAKIVSRHFRNVFGAAVTPGHCVFRGAKMSGTGSPSAAKETPTFIHNQRQ